MRNLKKYCTIVLICSLELLAQNIGKLNVNVIGDHYQERNLNITGNSDEGLSFSFNKTIPPNCSVPNVVQLNNTNIAFIFGLEGSVELNDIYGNLISKNYFYSLPPYNEQILKYSKVQDGIGICVSENQKNKFYYITNNGRIEDSLDLVNGLLKGFAISPNGKYIAYSTINNINSRNKKSTYLINRLTKDEVEYNYKFDQGHFGPENNLFLGHYKNQVFLIDIFSNEVLWKTKLGEDKSFIDAFVDERNIVLAEAYPPKFVKNEWVYNGCKIIVKNLAGKSLKTEVLNEPFDDIKIAKHENSIIIQTNREELRIK